MRDTDAGLTPREAQVRAELARLDCVAAGGHHYEQGRDDCVICGEPYPVIFEAEAHEFDLPGFVKNRSGEPHHVEVYMNGDHLIGHGACGPATRAEAERVFRQAAEGWEKLGRSSRFSADSLTRLGRRFLRR